MQTTTRRDFALTAAAALAAPSLSHAAAFAAPRSTPAPPPDEVLRLLKEGNARFAAGTGTPHETERYVR
ncbi:MAG TPA: hypothetical protein VK608_16490 [Edaphobacter sp.]|nr:hypothetical protein [Edaphobacter sp.]